MAPTCYLEQLIYDCRLMNVALADGPEAARLYRKWLVDSDAGRDPQAFIIAPASAVAVAQAIVRAPDPYHAGQQAALTALQLLRDAHRAGALRLAPRELPWLDRLQGDGRGAAVHGNRVHRSDAGRGGHREVPRTRLRSLTEGQSIVLCFFWSASCLPEVGVLRVSSPGGKLCRAEKAQYYGLTPESFRVTWPG
ncbi:MAG: hypothetical protein M5U12_25310 [Verrucomicrobia bacterium]|nr:hypothetical protein [Verrucomicrobiota bacterium]